MYGGTYVGGNLHQIWCVNIGECIVGASWVLIIIYRSDLEYKDRFYINIEYEVQTILTFRGKVMIGNIRTVCTLILNTKCHFISEQSGTL